MDVRVLALAQESGLTVGEFIAGIPHDPAAIIAYLLVIGFVGFIWWGNRRGSGTPTGPRGASTTVPDGGRDRESEEPR